MRRLLSFVVAALMLLGISTAVLANQGSSLPMSESQSVTITVTTGYKIEVSGDVSMNINPAISPVEDNSSTLTYGTNDGDLSDAKVTVKVDAIPSWLSALKLYTSSSLTYGSTSYTSAESALTLSTTEQDFITGISGAGSQTLTLVYHAEMTDWSVSAGTTATITVTYTFTTA